MDVAGPIPEDLWTLVYISNLYDSSFTKHLHLEHTHSLDFPFFAGT